MCQCTFENDQNRTSGFVDMAENMAKFECLRVFFEKPRDRQKVQKNDVENFVVDNIDA